MELTKEALKELYNNNSNKYVCEKLGISSPTLIRYLKLAKIKLKKKGNRSKKSKLTIVG